MIVVSNTSPLTNLAAIGQFDLLHIAGFYLEESFYQYVLDLAGEINKEVLK